MSKQVKHLYEFGPFRLDAVERVLLRDGHPVALTPKAVETLLVLIANGGHIVEKDDLMQAVWPDTFVAEDSLTRNISVLRKVLGEDAADTRYIETVPRRGYRFIAAVRQFVEDGGELIVARRARLRIVTEEEDETDEEGGATGQAARRLSLKEAVRSLAVLPFTPLNPDGSDDYLGLGIADALITRLSNVRQVVVRPTSAVLKYGGLRQDPASAGRELQVESVLEGSIQKQGDRIRVTVQLVSVEDDAPLWAEKFDEHLTDIFAVEDSISQQIVGALTLELSGEEHKRLTRRHTESAEAYQAYLQGRYFWNKRTDEWLKKASHYFQQAIDLDPDYALAYAGLADCYNMKGFWFFLPPKEAFPRAETAAARALELDEGLAEAHTSLAWARLHYSWDRAGAEREYERAIALNPGYVTAHQWYALFLAQAARFDHAFAAIKQAQALDPLSMIINYNIGVLFMLARRDDEAVEQFRKTIELYPNYYMAYSHLGVTYLLKGMGEEALAAFQKAVELAGPIALSGVGLCYAVCGRRDEARRALDEMHAAAKHVCIFPTGFAQIHAHLGETAQAFEWLEKAYEERDPWLTWLKVNPVFDLLHADVRFQDLLRRVGLAG